MECFALLLLLLLLFKLLLLLLADFCNRISDGRNAMFVNLSPFVFVSIKFVVISVEFWRRSCMPFNRNASWFGRKLLGFSGPLSVSDESLSNDFLFNLYSKILLSSDKWTFDIGFAEKFAIAGWCVLHIFFLLVVCSLPVSYQTILILWFCSFFALRYRRHSLKRTHALNFMHGVCAFYLCIFIDYMSKFNFKLILINLSCEFCSFLRNFLHCLTLGSSFLSYAIGCSSMSGSISFHRTNECVWVCVYERESIARTFFR